jgi:methylated-DNA-[protein]-cysteine S-methyltransferase
MTNFFTTVPSPFGPFSIAVDETGAVVATAFGDSIDLQGRLEAGCNLEESPTRTQTARAALEHFFATGEVPSELVLAPRGSRFQQRVWVRLRAIPRGHTRAYGEIAKELGSSARAVGRANATNPICLLIPCHRVIGRDGTLTGFAFGETIKRQLLAWEGVAPWAEANAELFSPANGAGA